MATVISQSNPVESLTLQLKLAPVVDMSDDQLFDFCQLNRNLRIERTHEGELVMMAPAGFELGRRNAEITRQLAQWAKGSGAGVVCDSSCGYLFQNGAVRAPDASWISYARLNTTSPEQRRRFLPVCPEFVVELRSPTDALEVLQAKMREYLDNGVLLGLLIDPELKCVYRYQADQPVETYNEPAAISCSPILAGFELSFGEIW